MPASAALSSSRRSRPSRPRRRRRPSPPGRRRRPRLHRPPSRLARPPRAVPRRPPARPPGSRGSSRPLPPGRRPAPPVRRACSPRSDAGQAGRSGCSCSKPAASGCACCSPTARTGAPPGSTRTACGSCARATASRSTSPRGASRSCAPVARRDASALSSGPPARPPRAGASRSTSGPANPIRGVPRPVRLASHLALRRARRLWRRGGPGRDPRTGRHEPARPAGLGGLARVRARRQCRHPVPRTGAAPRRSGRRSRR